MVRVTGWSPVVSDMSSFSNQVRLAKVRYVSVAASSFWTLACAADVDDPGATTATMSTTAGNGSAAGCDWFATSVVDHEFGEGPSEGQGTDDFPARVLGPPNGGGCCTGGLDVTSLGNGGWIILGFDAAIVDGPGADFIVFENAFDVGGNAEAPFAELASVAVSEDGDVWHEFTCDATEYPFDGCAGWHPVLANDEQPYDPGEPELAGGDGFDLAQLGVQRANWVRITDRVDLDDPLDCCFDLDAVALVNFECSAVSDGR